MAKVKGRWRCSKCGTTGWSKDGAVPTHNRSEGGSCRASGQKPETEIKRDLARKLKQEIARHG